MVSIQSPTRKLQKRGRKIVEDDKYFEDGENKIIALKQQLKLCEDRGAPVEERKQIRNQLSAQKSRIEKKKQLNMLKELILNNQRRNEQILELLQSSLAGKPEVMAGLKRAINKMASDEVTEGRLTEEKQIKRQKLEEEGEGWDMGQAYSNYMLLSIDHIQKIDEINKN